eukprot:498874_1
METVNQTTIRIEKDTEFPSIPSKWSDRFDVRVWNELKSVCNGVMEPVAHKKNKWTIGSCACFWLCAISAMIPLIIYIDQTADYNKCKRYWGGSAPGHCFTSDIDDVLFVVAMVFLGFAGLWFIIMAFAMYYCLKNTPHEIQGIDQCLDDLNNKYENLVVYKVKSDRNGKYFEVEIELKVQKISYIDDIQKVSSLPTQQQIMDQKNNSKLIENPGDEFIDKHYTKWTTKNVLDWILNLDDGKFKSYEQKLSETLVAEQINGNDICDLDKDDLHRLGVEHFKLKKSLMDHIKCLCQSDAHAVYTVDIQTIAPSVPYDMNNITQEENMEGAVTDC